MKLMTNHSCTGYCIRQRFIFIDAMRLLSLLISSVVLFIAPTHALSISKETKNDKIGGPILVVGATGGTGLRALQGLLDVGYEAPQIRVLSRNLDKPVVVALRERLGFQTCQANLDDGPSEELDEAVSGCVGCYIHSTSSDTRKLDTGEAERARTLATAIDANTDPSSSCHVVYNSAAGEPDHGVERIRQKQDVERVFTDNFPNVPFTSLRANLFMEELWKHYTRPSILKGKFPFSTPSERLIYLTSVRDMGRLAGTCLSQGSSTAGRTINVAGDVLTAGSVADAFAKAQKSPCVHSTGRFMAFLTRLFFRDLYEQIRFYRRSTETTDIQSLKEEFPRLLTDFDTFLDETDWGNQELTFENFMEVDRMEGMVGDSVSDKKMTGQ